MPAHPHPQVSGTRDWSNYLLDVARGLVPGAEPFGSYGRRTTAGAESNVLWPDGVYNLPPATGVQLTLVSTSDQDAAGGTGIRTGEIHYLDVNLDAQVEPLTMLGLTPFTTVATNIRFVQCIHLITAGSTKAAVGTISATTGGIIYAQIAAGAKRCTSSVRMVPRGKRLLVNALAGGASSGSADASAVLELATTAFEGHDLTSTGIFLPVAAAALQDDTSSLVLPVPFAFYEGAAVGMTFSVDKGATIIGSWFGLLENV